jgi:hypothetical protein
MPSASLGFTATTRTSVDERGYGNDPGAHAMRTRRRGICPALLLGLVLIASLSAAEGSPGVAMVEEFNGPFASWKNIKTHFGAVGDGVADDTAALKAGLASLPEHGKGKAGDAYVLYLPAGTYRITEPLVWDNRLGVALLGEDPARTTIRYDGPDGQPILTCHGVSYSKFGRITWDGQGKASAAIAHLWNPVTRRGPAVTYMEHADQVFMHVAKGIIGGTAVPVIKADGSLSHYNHGMDAEFLVKRCKFIRCSVAGLSIESFNALDWWVWDSEFVNCAVGATNAAGDTYGGGHFHLYRNVFRGSTIADVRTGHTNYFGIRFNTSIGSRRFLETTRPAGFNTPGLEHPTIRDWGKWPDDALHGSMHALQGNRILNPVDSTPIWINQQGPLMLFDNIIVVDPASGVPVVQVAPPTDGALGFSIGNAFYGADRVVVNGELTDLDNRTLEFARADLAVPALPAFAPRVERRMFQLAAGAKGEAIQQAIDEAATLAGQKPVIHLPAGRYPVAQTLKIPAHADLQFVGDGVETILVWEGEDEGTMLHIAGPSRATLRDFRIVGIWNSKRQKLGRGIVADHLDQPGGLILLDQVNANGCRRLGLLFDGLAQTRVEAVGSGGGGNQGPGLTVNGAGDQTAAWVGFFGGAGSNNQLTHVVKNQGRLMVWDTWYETSVSKSDSEPRYIHLTDRGYLTFFNGHIATLPGGDARKDLCAIDLDGFVGQVTLIGMQMNTNNPQLRVAGAGNDLNVLVLGADFAKTEPWLDHQAQAAKLAVLASRKELKPLPPVGESSPAFLRAMLKDARTVVPTTWQPAPEGATDLRLHRVTATYQIGEGMLFLGALDRPAPR